MSDIHKGGSGVGIVRLQCECGQPLDVFHDKTTCVSSMEPPTLQEALADVDALADGSEPDTFWVIVAAAKEQARWLDEKTIIIRRSDAPLLAEAIFKAAELRGGGHLHPNEDFIADVALALDTFAVLVSSPRSCGSTRP